MHFSVKIIPYKGLQLYLAIIPEEYNIIFIVIVKMTMGNSADEILLQIKEKAVKPSSSIYWHFLHAFFCGTNSLSMEQSVI